MSKSHDQLASLTERAQMIRAELADAARQEVAATAALHAAVDLARTQEDVLDVPTFLRNAEVTRARTLVNARQHDLLVARDLLLKLQSQEHELFVRVQESRLVCLPAKFYGGGEGIPDRPGPDDAIASAARDLSSIPSWVPRRICEEEVGDALEYIARVACTNAPGWEREVRRKVWTTKFWIFWNAVREIVSAALGKKGA